jgi:hypothetical protein
MLKGRRDLKVYQLSYKLAMEISISLRLFLVKRSTHSLTKFAGRHAALPQI